MQTHPNTTTASSYHEDRYTSTVWPWMQWSGYKDPPVKISGVSLRMQWRAATSGPGKGLTERLIHETVLWVPELTEEHHKLLSEMRKEIRDGRQISR